MASSTDDYEQRQLVDLVRRLAAKGKAFSISIADPNDPLVEKARNAPGNFRFTGTDDVNCTKWVYVPGLGPVCVEHG
jgi:hypothetical protein